MDESVSNFHSPQLHGREKNTHVFPPAVKRVTMRKGRFHGASDLGDAHEEMGVYSLARAHLNWLPLRLFPLKGSYNLLEISLFTEHPPCKPDQVKAQNPSSHNLTTLPPCYSPVIIL
jgi:hypothetical protein